MIKNIKNLSNTSLRRKALLIADAGYEAINIPRAIKEKIKLNGGKLSIQIASISKGKEIGINLSDYKRIFVVGIGKGSALASINLAKILGKNLTGGVFLDTVKLKTKGYKLKAFQGAHPLPSRQNIKASKEIIKLVRELKKEDLLITFICGGGSALFCSSDAELKASTAVFKKLTEAGADIFELNTVRKHVSRVKGGGLAKMAWPATVVSLVVSDVLGNDLSMVASGPTVFDETIKKDAEKVLKKYKIKKLGLIETPKDKKYFKNAKNVLFASNYDPLSAMAERAKKLGFKPKIFSYMLKGEAKKSLLLLMEVIKDGEVILAGGETVVKLKTKNLKLKAGKGGRNTEAVLGVISNWQFPISKNSVVISLASDGRDNTEAAGAIGDILTLKKAKKLKLNPELFLENHNSFNFFKKTGDLIFTNKTSFNIADLMLVLKDLKG